MTVRTATPSGAWKLALSMAAVCAAFGTRAAAAPAPSQPAQPPPSPQPPQPPPPNDSQAKARAQALLTAGTAAYGHGDYAIALDKFTAAYKIFPSPKLWFNIGQANRDLGRPVDAVAAFDRFLREAGNAPPETLAEARRSAAELKAKLGQINVTCTTDGADVTVDGKPIGSTPLGEMVWTTAGRHQVAVQHPGFTPAIEDVPVAIGKASSVNFQLSPIDLQLRNRAAAGGGAGVPERKPVYKRPWFLIAVSALVAAGATTAIILSTRNAGGLETTLGAQKVF